MNPAAPDGDSRLDIPFPLLGIFSNNHASGGLILTSAGRPSPR